jgi:hypothetical protein
MSGVTPAPTSDAGVVVADGWQAMSSSPTNRSTTGAVLFILVFDMFIPLHSLSAVMGG